MHVQRLVAFQFLIFVMFRRHCQSHHQPRVHEQSIRTFDYRYFWHYGQLLLSLTHMSISVRNTPLIRFVDCTD
ncbi:hypothetical protein EV424DRAFT_212248 [Suillus variegatus]|nr:hypothetical protein EV424DRAFT_212248 [Suillus variegatus]